MTCHDEGRRKDLTTSSISDTSTAERRGGCSLTCQPPTAGKEGEEVSHSTRAALDSDDPESVRPLAAVSGLRPSHSADATVTSRPDRETVDLMKNNHGIKHVSFSITTNSVELKQC